jgi:hypothetical protein
MSCEISVRLRHSLKCDNNQKVLNSWGLRISLVSMVQDDEMPVLRKSAIDHERCLCVLHSKEREIEGYAAKLYPCPATCNDPLDRGKLNCCGEPLVVLAGATRVVCVTKPTIGSDDCIYFGVVS